MRSPPRCPICWDAGRPVLFGLPTSETREAIDEGLIVWHGCMRFNDGESWMCSQGHEWPADEHDWHAALRGAVRGRPGCPTCGGPSVELFSPTDPNLDVWVDYLREGNAIVDDRPDSPDNHRCTDCGHRWP